MSRMLIFGVVGLAAMACASAFAQDEAPYLEVTGGAAHSGSYKLQWGPPTGWYAGNDATCGTADDANPMITAYHVGRPSGGGSGVLHFSVWVHCENLDPSLSVRTIILVRENEGSGATKIGSVSHGNTDGARGVYGGTPGWQELETGAAFTGNFATLDSDDIIQLTIQVRGATEDAVIGGAPASTMLLDDFAVYFDSAPATNYLSNGGFEDGTSHESFLDRELGEEVLDYWPPPSCPVVDEPGGDESQSDAILSAYIENDVVRSVTSHGDLWPSTWASDDNVYLSWGDGTGCSGCEWTAAGLIRLEGHVDDFDEVTPEIVRSIDVPVGTGSRTDKASSLLYSEGVLYWAGHLPPFVPTQGYIAYSTDFGSTWTEVPGTPWGAASNFRVLMLINMGKNYELNSDGYVYGFGIGEELHLPPNNQSVYLARTPKESIADYGAYSYYAGRDAIHLPVWSSDQADAIPLDGLTTAATGAAMYHPGVQRYLFLALPLMDAQLTLTLYEAPTPWGPWKTVQSFPGEYYIPGIISKFTEPNAFYFTAAGGSESYNMHIGKMVMEAPEQLPVRHAATIVAALMLAVLGAAVVIYRTMKLRQESP